MMFLGNWHQEMTELHRSQCKRKTKIAWSPLKFERSCIPWYSFIYHIGYTTIYDEPDILSHHAGSDDHITLGLEKG